MLLADAVSGSPALALGTMKKPVFGEAAAARLVPGREGKPWLQAGALSCLVCACVCAGSARRWWWEPPSYWFPLVVSKGGGKGTRGKGPGEKDLGYVQRDLAGEEPRSSNPRIPALVLVVLVFSFITLAGVFLWRGEKHAETLTALAQGVQLPMILSPAVGYYCIAGIGLQLKAEGLWDWGFYFHLGSMFHVSWGGHPITVLGINIVPVLVLFWLIKQPDTSAVTPSSTVGAV